MDRAAPLERKTLVFAVAGLLALLLTLGIGFALFGGDDDAEDPSEPVATKPADVGPPPQPDFVDIPVTSEPDDVKVLLEGVEQGRTPMTLSDLIPGESYEIRFEKDGFRATSRRMTVSVDSKPMAVELDSAEGDGVLKVTTFPTNAIVSLDDRQVGKSPVTIDGLERTGSHEVSAELPGRDKVSKKFEWEGDRRVYRMSLEFEAEDDDEVDEESRRVRRPTRTKRRERRTRPSRSTGRSTSKSTQKDEKASLDLWGDGEGSKSSSSNGSAGSSSSGSGDKPEAKLNVWGDDNGKEEKAAKGYLSVQVQRGWGKVFVNGRLVAKETPMIKHPVEIGTHRVKVYYPKLKRYSNVRRVSVQPGKTSTEIFTP